MSETKKCPLCYLSHCNDKTFHICFGNHNSLLNLSLSLSLSLSVLSKLPLICIIYYVFAFIPLSPACPRPDSHEKVCLPALVITSSPTQRLPQYRRCHPIMAPLMIMLNMGRLHRFVPCPVLESYHGEMKM